MEVRLTVSGVGAPISDEKLNEISFRMNLEES